MNLETEQTNGQIFFQIFREGFSVKTLMSFGMKINRYA